MSGSLPAEPTEIRPRDYRLGAMLFFSVVGAAIGFLVIAVSIDVTVTELSWDGIVEAATRAGLANAMGGLAEVLAAVLGLSLTVVAIVVQLASQRYPAKIVDLFMFDTINVATFGFMASSCVYVVLLPGIATDGNVPVFATGLGLALTVANFGLLLPYFGHVFAFLEPTNLITQIEDRARTMLRAATDAELTGARLAQAQKQVAMGLERIADNCMAAVSQSDRNLALHSVRTIESFVTRYLGLKGRLASGWNDVDWKFFGTLAQEFVDQIVANGTWLEAKALMEFERIIRRALVEMTEVVSQLAASTRAIGAAAIDRDDRDALELVVRFFNTYVRHGLNAGNVRAVYNVLYEYRRLALVVFEYDPQLGKRIVEHLVYYGRTANDMKMPFVTVTVAHDVRVICQEVFESDSTDIRKLLRLFLTLDQPSEVKSEEVALIGVRKAQSILAGFFVQHGAEDLVELIRDDMAEEDSFRLDAIRDEILSVDERKFWEITDRGLNFDYVEPGARPYLEEFFESLQSSA